MSIINFPYEPKLSYLTGAVTQSSRKTILTSSVDTRRKVVFLRIQNESGIDQSYLIQIDANTVQRLFSSMKGSGSESSATMILENNSFLYVEPSNDELFSYTVGYHEIP